jgi:hypothetical protein
MKTYTHTLEPCSETQAAKVFVACITNDFVAAFHFVAAFAYLACHSM